MSYRIVRGEPIDDAIRRIAYEQIDKAIAEANGPDVDAAVHAVRKRCKRIRALLRLARTPLGDAYRTENAWYREAARRLAHARDAAVRLATFDALVARFDPGDPGALAPLRAALQTQRDPARGGEALREELQEFVERLERGRERVGSWPLEGHGFAAIAADLARIYGHARRRMERAADEATAELLHEWRKRVKDHGYHMQLLHDAWPQVLKARRKETEALGSTLGDHNDLDVLHDHLLADATLRDTEGAALLVPLIERSQSALRSDAFTKGNRLFGEKPKAFRRRMTQYWDAWAAQEPKLDPP